MPKEAAHSDTIIITGVKENVEKARSRILEIQNQMVSMIMLIGWVWANPYAMNSISNVHINAHIYMCICYACGFFVSVLWHNYKMCWRWYTPSSFILFKSIFYEHIKYYIHCKKKRFLIDQQIVLKDHPTRQIAQGSNHTMQRNSW